WTFGGGAGGTYASLQDFNGALNEFLTNKYDTFEAWEAASGASASGSWATNNQVAGYLLRGDVTWHPTARLGFSVRGEYLGVLGIRAHFYGAGTTGDTLEYSLNGSLTLIPVQGGLTLEFPLGDSGLIVSGSLLAGRAFAAGHIGQHQTFRSASSSTSDDRSVAYDLRGSAPIASAEAGFLYRLSESSDIVIEVGRRWANVRPMIIQQNIDANGDGVLDIHKGNPYRNVGHTRTVAFDYSGLAFTLGVRLRI
ncbi:MAG TPA: hypothetical protein VNM37_19110, partial [Candidatus Dormibacteraeota bacterium]|nr:hypothetical protein [Candidatus Dormibacteraeota bacterium]